MLKCSSSQQSVAWANGLWKSTQDVGTLLNRVLENREPHKSGARIPPTALRHRKPGDQFTMISLGRGTARLASSDSAPISGAHGCPRSGVEGLPSPSQSIHAQLTVNVFAALVPPPGVGLKTVTLSAPAVLMSATGTVAVNVVLLTYLVVSFVPFHSITELET